MLGNGFIQTSWFGDLAPEGTPMSHARGCQRRPEICKGVNKGYMEGTFYGGDGPDELSFFKEVGSTVWGPTYDLGPFVESMVPERGQLL
jgi:hypothetical protein